MRTSNAVYSTVPSSEAPRNPFEVPFSTRHYLELSDPVQQEEDAVLTTVGLLHRLEESSPSLSLTEPWKLLDRLSFHAGDLGLRDEAFHTAEWVVRIIRRLAGERPRELAPDRATSHNNLSVRFSDLGRREEGQKAIEEAVDIRRHLASERPAAFEPALTGSLNDLAIGFSDLGRREESPKAIEEAVIISRRLASERHATSEPILSESLHTLSIRFSDLGRKEEAPKVIQEAVEHSPPSCVREASRLRARPCYNLSHRLCDLGGGEEAPKAIEDAMEIHACHPNLPSARARLERATVDPYALKSHLGRPGGRSF